jgi:hypothetical protein
MPGMQYRYRNFMRRVCSEEKIIKGHHDLWENDGMGGIEKVIFQSDYIIQYERVSCFSPILRQLQSYIDSQPSSSDFICFHHFSSCALPRGDISWVDNT